MPEVAGRWSLASHLSLTCTPPVCRALMNAACVTFPRWRVVRAAGINVVVVSRWVRVGGQTAYTWLNIKVPASDKCLGCTTSLGTPSNAHGTPGHDTTVGTASACCGHQFSHMQQPRATCDVEACIAVSGVSGSPVTNVSTWTYIPASSTDC